MRHLYSRLSAYISVILAIFCLVVTLQGCTKAAENRAMEPGEAFGMMRNRFAVVLDVRERAEMTDGMVAGALWIPFSKIESNHADWQEFKSSKLSADKTTVIYCGSGVRAKKVADLLNPEGFKTGVIGGFRDWKQANLPTQPAPDK